MRACTRVPWLSCACSRCSRVPAISCRVCAHPSPSDLGFGNIRQKYTSNQNRHVHAIGTLARCDTAALQEQHAFVHAPPDAHTHALTRAQFMRHARLELSFSQNQIAIVCVLRAFGIAWHRMAWRDATGSGRHGVMLGLCTHTLSHTRTYTCYICLAMVICR